MNFPLVRCFRGREFAAEGKEVNSRELSATPNARLEEAGDCLCHQMNGDGEEDESQEQGDDLDHGTTHLRHLPRPAGN